MNKLITFLFLIIPMFGFSQNTALSMFDNLVGKTWEAEGNWGDGSKFYQKVEINYSLDSAIILVDAIGYTNKEQTKIGPRNHGIRQYDQATETVNFWEFDVFGGLTKGTVRQKGKSIVYQYQYGESYVTDMWEYVDDTTYNFIVGDYQDGVWKQTYLKTVFKMVVELDGE